MPRNFPFKLLFVDGVSAVGGSPGILFTLLHFRVTPFPSIARQLTTPHHQESTSIMEDFIMEHSGISEFILWIENLIGNHSSSTLLQNFIYTINTKKFLN